MSELSGLIRTRLGVKGKSLSRQLQGAARRIPRRLRGDLEPFIQADQFHGHPRLVQMLDQSRLDSGFARLQSYLTAIDPNERRARRFQRAMGTFTINLVIIASLLYAVLRWRGFL